MSRINVSPLSLLLPLLLLFTGCAEKAAEQVAPQTVDPEIARLEARAANVTIIRDDFGVPHIYAKTDADAESLAPGAT